MYACLRINREKAEKLLAAPPRPLAKKRKILKVDLFYLPHYIYSLKIRHKNGTLANATICVDGLQGVYGTFSEAETEENPVLPARILKAKLTCQQAQEDGVEEFRRFMLKISLKKKSLSEIESCEYRGEIFYPFWVGYFRRKGAYDFEAIDAISGQKQGAKMKPVFMEAILNGKKE